MGKKINTFLLTISFVLFSLSTLTLAVDCPIPDTGQTKCYNNTQEIFCPLPGQPFYGQDAQYPCNPQSYTKLDANGNDLPNSATEWIMVQDNVTGLIWENKTDDGSIHDKDNIYNWNDAQSVFIATLNSQNFGGYSDWRLPTVKELSFLVNGSGLDPLINTTYFPNTVSSYYWSSTTNAYGPGGAWGVGFGGGGIYGYDKSDHYYYVRAVRGGQCGSFDNFIDNGDGTVTNTDTGLMWELKTDDGGNRDKDNRYTWEEALSYCENLTLARYSDWRLPNLNELQSIVDYSNYDPSINTTFFPNAVSSWYYWSSTTYAYFPEGACVVYFYDGYVYSSNKSYYYYVRAVRSGQCGSLCPTEQLYGEYSEQTDFLRHFRDNVLNTTPEGRELIKFYYEWSPVIVKSMEENEEFKQDVKQMIDGVVTLIGEEE